jgi:hypothetical protein
MLDHGVWAEVKVAIDEGSQGLGIGQSPWLSPSGRSSVWQTVGYTAAMPRQRVWIENTNFESFGCSECNWVFKPSGALIGESLDEMKEKYEVQA